MSDEWLVIRPCVRCGFCCRQGPCGYGHWDRERKCCAHLTEDSLCGLYDEIILSGISHIHPGFGTGCSSVLFNPDREKKISELRAKLEGQLKEVEHGK